MNHQTFEENTTKQRAEAVQRFEETMKDSGSKGEPAKGLWQDEFQKTTKVNARAGKKRLSANCQKPHLDETNCRTV